MGCCVQRAKFDEFADQDDMLRSANMLPTYENITSLYEKVGLPVINEGMLAVKKEQMLFMIINLIRVKPTVFIHQLNTFKVKCDMRQKPKNIVFYSDDVQSTVEFME